MIFSIFYRQGDFESETGHCTLIFREGFEFNLISMFENFVLKICLAQIWMQTKGCQSGVTVASEEQVEKDSLHTSVYHLLFCVESNIWDKFCDILLNKLNCLSAEACLSCLLEQTLSCQIFAFALTPASLRMLMTLFDPKEFGGCFFLQLAGDYPICTDLTLISKTKGKVGQ